jgi:hypothetical protein
MKGFVGVTDNAWFTFLSQQPGIDEVNFWQPGGQSQFRSLSPGEPFFFKLHAPHNFIVGGGFFAHSTILPISLAWSAFGKKNGAGSHSEMRNRTEKYRRSKPSPFEDYKIGCILLTQPVFFKPQNWIRGKLSYTSTLQPNSLHRQCHLEKLPYQDWRESLLLVAIHNALARVSTVLACGNQMGKGNCFSCYFNSLSTPEMRRMC